MAPPKKRTDTLTKALQSRMQSTTQPTQPGGVELPTEQQVPARRRTASARKSKPDSQMAQADLEDQPARTINTRASNKTAHPGQIIRDNTQKRRSSAEVRAANNAKKADKLMKSLINDQAHHDALDKIAEEEERLFLEDFARRCVAERPDIDVGGESGTNRDASIIDDIRKFQLSKHAMKASKPKNVTSRVVNVSDGEEGGASMSEGPSLPDINAPDFTWEDVEVQEVDSVAVVDVSDTDSQDHEYQPTRDEERSDVEDMDVIAIPEKKTSSTAKGKAAQATSGKRERGVVRADVLAQRERLREATSVGTKRKAQGASTGGSIKDHESGKRAKTMGLGGLRKDWRPPNQLKPEQRSSASHATSRELPTNLNNGLSDHDDDVQTDGEWDADETTDMLEAVRTSKTATVRQAGLQASTQGPGTRTTAARNTSQHAMRLSIASTPARADSRRSVTTNSSRKNLPARSNPAYQRPSVPPFTQDYQPESTSEDVAAIATPNTLAIAGSSARPNQKVAIRDLPFPRGQWSAYMQKWKVLRASLINWSGTLPDMFSASSHPEFLPTLKQLWIETFPELADAADDRALIIIAGATIGDHRSAIGKAAVAVVANLIPADATTPQEVLNALKSRYCTVPEFIYRDPSGAPGNRGSYLSDLILKVLAVHMGVVLQAQKAFGRPAGALALVCAAIERALDGWKEGVNQIEEAKKDPKRNKSHGFKAERWGPVAARWLKGIDKNMTDKRWEILFRDTSVFIPDRLSNDIDCEPFAEGDIRDIDGSGDEFLE